MPTPPIPDGNTERPPEGTPAPQGGTQAPDLDARVAGAVEKALGPVAERLGQLGQGLQAVQQHLATPPKPAPPAAPPGNPVDQLVAAPDTYIDERARNLFNTASQTTLTPWMAGQTEATIEHNLASERSRIDAEYGEGTFDELAAGPARQILANMPLQSQVRTQVARGAVDTALAPKIGELVTRKQKMLEKAKEAPLELLRGGGGTNRRGENALSPDEQKVLEEWNERSSIPYDAKTYALARDTKSVKAWKAATAGTKRA